MEERNKTSKGFLMKKAVIGLSGGMDSSTLLGMLLEDNVKVHACHFQYGSKHNPYEKRAMDRVLEYYTSKKFPIEVHRFDVGSSIFKMFDSHLLLDGDEIPEGHFESSNMKQTVVPGRNTIFAAIMLGLAQTVCADTIALGVHAGDHVIYPDCRASYIQSLHTTIQEASDGAVNISAPFLDMDKSDILTLGYGLTYPVPYHRTRTCYKPQLRACGRCGSCQERLEAFEKVGKVDPIVYKCKNKIKK